jgi:ribosomal protein S18 acetylase RimI-like enzyme
MVITQLAAQPLRIETHAGVAEWRVLEWDTAQFGIPAARLELLDAVGSYAQSCAEKRRLLESVVNQCRSLGVQHLSARVDGGNFTTIHALEGANFELIDCIQTFLLQLNGMDTSSPPDTRLFEAKDFPEVLEIARTAFVFDRFHGDPALSNDVADKIHESWTRNCCLGTAADAVVVAEVEGRIASYVACRAGLQALTGTIILVATGEWARGRGAAHRATLAALHWLATRGMKCVEVGTQLRNIPAARLYENLGFRMNRASLTFRRIL